MSKITLRIIVVLFLVACSDKSASTEEFQSLRSNIKSVDDKLVDIRIDTTILFGRKTWLFVLNDYLIACDHQNPEKGIHVFDKNTFEYLTSTGLKGQGPREIVRYAHMGVDSKNNTFYMSDYGKRVAFKFNLDSVLLDTDYMPTKSFSLLDDLFPTFYDFVSDSVIVGAGLDVIDRQNFNSTLVKYNINNGRIEKLGKPNSTVEIKNVSTYFALSNDYDFCVETFSERDLMIIRDLQGNIIKNVYGPQWEESEPKNDYYYITDILGDKVLASFNGSKSYYLDEHKRPRSVFPSKLLIVDSKGTYLNTLKVDDGIFHFCVDESNNRLIFSFSDRENQFAYLDMEDIL